MTKIELLAVDLDGTLVDSAPDLAYCVDIALASVGLPPPAIERTRAWIGDGIERLLQRAFAFYGERDDTPAFGAAVERFSACYLDNLFVRSTLYPGVIETLARLGDEGVALACVTNKRAAFADGVLTAAGIRDHFGALYGGDSLLEKKPHPSQLLAAAHALGVRAANAAMVGDSHHDYDAAAAAGFAFVWAAYGYCQRIDARSGVPIARIDAFSELTPALLDAAGREHARRPC